MREIEQYSITSYTSLIVWVFNVLALLIVYFIVKKYRKKLLIFIGYIQKVKISNIKYYIIIFYFILFLLIFNILISGSPLWVSTINKTTFWTIAKLSFLKPLSSQISVISLFSGMFLVYFSFHKRKVKILNFFIYGIWILTLIYLVLMGHKFGQLLTITYMFFLPILSYKALTNTLSINKTVIQFIAILFIFSIFVKMYFVRVYGDYAMDLIEQRIFAMEGQLTYTTISNFLENKIYNDFSQLLIEIKYIFGLTNQPAGMDYLMYKIMPLNLLSDYENMHVKLAQGYIALLLYLFNNIFLALMIHSLFISIYGIISIQLLKSILKYDFWMTFLYLKIYFAFNTYYAQAYTTAILNLKIFLFVYIILLIIIIRKQQFTKKGKVFSHDYSSYNRKYR